MTAAKKYIFIVLTLLMGVVFLYSAYTKVIPVQAFAYTLQENAGFSQKVAAIAARFFAGLEAGLGILLLFNLFGKRKWVVKMAFILLLTFSAFLIYLWASKGNVVNCGCFGDTLLMSPAASLAKNALLLVVTGILIRYHNGFLSKPANTIAPFILLLTIILPYIIFPVLRPYKIDLNGLYSGAAIPGADLRKGKHIIAFLSPSCIHCRRAAHKLEEDLRTDPTLPFFMVIGGTKSDLTDFWKASQAQNIPYVRMEAKLFKKYTGDVFPYIIWVNNGIVEEETSYKDLSTTAIEKWVKN